METIHEGSFKNDEYYALINKAAGRDERNIGSESIMYELAIKGLLNYFCTWRNETQEIEYFLGKYDDSNNIVKISFTNFDYIDK